ncbi:MAG: hypothetical protein V3R74_01860 [Alphaproteobacteria bacterium]
MDAADAFLHAGRDEGRDQRRADAAAPPLGMAVDVEVRGIGVEQVVEQAVRIDVAIEPPRRSAVAATGEIAGDPAARAERQVDMLGLVFPVIAGPAFEERLLLLRRRELPHG